MISFPSISHGVLVIFHVALYPFLLFHSVTPHVSQDMLSYVCGNSNNIEYECHRMGSEAAFAHD